MPDDSDDRRGVYRAASVLNVSEFDVFGLAYQHWFGRPAAADEVSAEFKQYLRGNTIPPWVRDFIRRVNTLSREQRLAPSLRPALGPPPQPVGCIRTYLRSRLSLRTREIIIGSLALVGLVIVVFVLVYLAATTQQAAPLPCTLPPCY